MTGGGIVELVARAKQDTYLINDPQITFFKTLYRRHTNFSTELIAIQFKNKPNFGDKACRLIPKTGDLVRKMYIAITLPEISKFIDGCCDDLITKFAWVNRIGYAIIKYVEIEIGDILIDRHYGDWLNIWTNLTIIDKKKIDRLIGNYDEITQFTNGKKSFKIYIPLQFWFNRHTGLALPIVALSYSNVKINLKLNPLEYCSKLSPTHFIEVASTPVFREGDYIVQNNAISQFIYYDSLTQRMYYNKMTKNGFIDDMSEICKLNIFTNVSEMDGCINVLAGSLERPYVAKLDCCCFKLIDCYLLIEYIYVDVEERMKFLQNKHEYLIEQVIYNGEKILNNKYNTVTINASQICKEILWVTQLEESICNKDYFNYTDNIFGLDLLTSVYFGNLIRNETILFNNNERLSLRDSRYFTEIQRWQNHTNGIGMINSYAFALYPELLQPSCVANLNAIDCIDLKLELDSSIKKRPGRIRGYSFVYNILRIIGGISGLVFV